MNTCPKCQTQNKPTAKFCRGCGNTLAVGGAPNAAASAQKMCPNGHVYQGAQCPYCPTPGAFQAANAGPRPPAAATDVEDGQRPVRPSGGMKIPGKNIKTVVEGDNRQPRRGKRGATVVDEGGPKGRLVGWLVVLNSPIEDSYKDFQVYDGNTIMGNKPGAKVDIIIKDERVSGQHAKVEHEDGKYYLTDMGSSNGTMLNGEKVRDVELNDGDRIKVGRTTLVFRSFQHLAD